MRRKCRESFPHHRLQRKPLVSDPDMHHGTCVTHVPWCMSVSLNRGSGGKRSRHSRRMRNQQFYVSGKRPMASQNPDNSKTTKKTSKLHIGSLWGNSPATGGFSLQSDSKAFPYYNVIMKTIWWIKPFVKLVAFRYFHLDADRLTFSLHKRRRRVWWSTHSTRNHLYTLFRLYPLSNWVCILPHI